MTQMIEIKDKSQCCGCNACVQRCPKQCIAMCEDEEGFLYPEVDEAICIDCGLCENVCPVINQADARIPLQVYAAKNTDEKYASTALPVAYFLSWQNKQLNKEV